MSNPIQSTPTPTGEFPAQLAGAPGSPDLAAESKKWERRCDELLTERQELQEELAKTQRERDQYVKSLYHLLCKDYVCPYTKEELFANAVYEPSIEDLIAGLNRDQEG